MITLQHVRKRYASVGEGVWALAGVSLKIATGESVAVMGPSGSGKSTLLNIIGLLTTPTEGQIWLDGVDVTGLSAAGRAHLRNRSIGFIFQHYGLLPDLTVWENVELPLIYGGHRGDRAARIRKFLEAVGMGALAQRRPSQLSGGQQQRVAIARALVTGAPLILADEPTGALDTQTGAEILNLLLDLNRQGHTLVVVTHNEEVAQRCGRALHVRDGKLSEEMDSL